jgi:hypothetical protein
MHQEYRTKLNSQPTSQSNPPFHKTKERKNRTSTSVKHTHTDNGGAARDWKVLSIRPPLRGATALHAIPSADVSHLPVAEKGTRKATLLARTDES